MLSSSETFSSGEMFSRLNVYKGFWQLPITREFPRPSYHIGQVVLHKVKTGDGIIGVPVVVLGCYWNAREWDYAVEYPYDHPSFRNEDGGLEWLTEKYFEAL